MLRWLRCRRDDVDPEDDPSIVVTEEGLYKAGVPASRAASFLRQFGIETSRSLRAHRAAHLYCSSWGVVFATVFVFSLFMTADASTFFSCCRPVAWLGGWFAATVASGAASVAMFALAKLSVQSREQHEEIKGLLSSGNDDQTQEQ